MKPIKVYVSDDSTPDSVVAYLESRIPEGTRNSPEYAYILPEIKSCVIDFSTRAKKLAKTGTTVRIDKEFILQGIDVHVVLEYPRNLGFFERIKVMLRSCQ